MPAFAPTLHPRDPADNTRARVAVRTDGTSGFLFMNNYVRQLEMPARPGFQAAAKLPGDTQIIPAKPINILANSYFCWPFQLPLGAGTLRYSTAQLLTHLQTSTGEVVVFCNIPGIPSEFAFDRAHLSSILSSHATISWTSSAVRVNSLNPGMNSTIEVADDRGHKVTILLLPKEQAEQTTVLHTGKQDYLLMTRSSVLFDGSHFACAPRKQQTSR